MIKKNTMISGYLHIDSKDIEKTKKEARKIYGDFEKPKTYSMEATPCPKCGFDWSMEQHIEFDNALQGLAWCYINPMKKIEVEYKGKILLFRFNGKKLEEKYVKDAHLSGIIVSSWSIVEAIYIEDIEKSWKNIKTIQRR